MGSGLTALDYGIIGYLLLALLVEDIFRTDAQYIELRYSGKSAAFMSIIDTL